MEMKRDEVVDDTNDATLYTNGPVMELMGQLTAESLRLKEEIKLAKTNLKREILSKKLKKNNNKLFQLFAFYSQNGEN